MYSQNNWKNDISLLGNLALGWFEYLKQGITNMLALPIDKMLYIYLLAVLTLWTPKQSIPIETL
jgi:hypothetical protein